MDLSIIIVNYNVRHFLEQCIRSALRATQNMEAEIIVVDNNSKDGSQEMMRQVFGAQIHLIANTDNPGFSKANNQGLRIAKGRYCLLLNPDTVVGEDTFDKCLAFMDAHPKAGALGLNMIDGNGVFLPESKRALPTPWVSFYKIFGFAALFPKSKKFGQYHLTYLDRHETHPVEILSGAYMWMRKEALDKIGLLDETFFMYGEDIDLSYRFILAGYQNYYFADTRIIHYKGESTKKGSLNYVRVFYQAMIIFARKHFGGQDKTWFIAAIRLAVYVRALIAILRRLWNRFSLPLLEFGLIYATMFGIKAYWEHYVKYIEGGRYPDVFVEWYMPIYSLVFVGLLGLAGAYKRPFRLKPLVVAPALAFIGIATATYTFSWIQNFSRAIVGLSAIFTTLIAFTTRGILHRIQGGSFFFTETPQRKVAMIGAAEEVVHMENILKRQRQLDMQLVGHILPEPKESTTHPDSPLLGSLDDLEILVKTYQLDELIIADGKLPLTDILALLERMAPTGLSCKLAPADTDMIIGPQTVWRTATAGGHAFALKMPGVQQRKRLFDLTASTGLLLTFPLLFWAYRRPQAAIKQIWNSWRGKAHVVGYTGKADESLPNIKPGLLSLRHRNWPEAKTLDTKGLNLWYARSYRWSLDLEILWKGWRAIGDEQT